MSIQKDMSPYPGEPNAITYAAIKEAETLLADPANKLYTCIQELMAALIE